RDTYRRELQTSALGDRETLLDQCEARCEMLRAPTADDKTVHRAEVSQDLRVAELGRERAGTACRLLGIAILLDPVDDAHAEHAERRLDDDALALLARIAACERSLGEIVGAPIEAGSGAERRDAFGVACRAYQGADRLFAILAPGVVVGEQRRPL